jgi:hypothetical protein
VNAVQRRRTIAAAPERRASETWEVISALVADTLDRSASITRGEVVAAMETAAPAGRMLVAGGHLDAHSVVLVAAPVHLSITTVSGVAATTLEENLEPVPGGATATAWTIYLPTPDPLGDAVRAVAAGSPHLSAEEAPADAEPSVASSTRPAGRAAGVIDLAAFGRRDERQEQRQR